MDPRIEKCANTDPKEPELTPLNEKEQDCFVENAAELNWMLSQIYANDGRNGSAAELAIYAFHLGREFEKKEKKHGWF